MPTWMWRWPSSRVTSTRGRPALAECLARPWRPIRTPAPAVPSAWEAWLPSEPHRARLVDFLSKSRAYVIWPDGSANGRGEQPLVQFEDGGLMPMSEVRWSDAVRNFYPASQGESPVAGQTVPGRIIAAAPRSSPDVNCPSPGPGVRRPLVAIVSHGWPRCTPAAPAGGRPNSAGYSPARLWPCPAAPSARISSLPAASPTPPTVRLVGPPHDLRHCVNHQDCHAHGHAGSRRCRSPASRRPGSVICSTALLSATSPCGRCWHTPPGLRLSLSGLHGPAAPPRLRPRSSLPGR